MVRDISIMTETSLYLAKRGGDNIAFFCCTHYLEFVIIYICKPINCFNLQFAHTLTT